MSAGLTPFGALSPADIARLMQQARPQVDVTADDVPAAIPPGFTGFVPPTAPTMQQQVAAAAPAVEPEAPARAPLRMFGALPPQMSAPMAAEPERAPLPSLVGSRAPALPVSATAAPRVGDEAPAAAVAPRPLSFGSLPAPAAPATTGSTTAPTAPVASSAAAEPSLLDRIGDGLRNLNANGGGDLLTSLGIGLMSTPGFGRGAAAGLKAYQDNEGKRAASDLARAEFGLKVRKDAQEQRQLSGNAQYVTSKIPGISPEQALTLGGNSIFMNELFKGVLPPSELYKQYTDDKGNIWNQNARTGQATVALKADDDKTVTPLAEADRVALGLPAGSYQKDANGKISPINATGTTINMGAEKAQDQEIGKYFGKQYVDLQTTGRNAGNKLNTLALMEQAMNAPGFYSGAGGDVIKRANQALGALGVKDPKAASGAEVFDALGNQVVLDQLGGSLGAGISDSDRKSIALIGPSIQKTPEGNKQLIGIYRSVAQREQQVAQMARDYAKANGGRLDSVFEDQVAQYAAANPLFPAAQGGAKAQSDGVTGPTAAPGLAAPRTQADFDALPKGAMYVDPSDGRRYRKN